MPCTLPAFRRLDRQPVRQSQEDCGPKPMVATKELPWECGGWFSQPHRGCGPETNDRPMGHNPVGVDARGRTLPRVGAGHQPWAGGWNPVGIRDTHRAGRKVHDLFDGDACKVQHPRAHSVGSGLPSLPSTRPQIAKSSSIRTSDLFTMAGRARSTW